MSNYNRLYWIFLIHKANITENIEKDGEDDSEVDESEVKEKNENEKGKDENEDYIITRSFQKITFRVKKSVNEKIKNIGYDQFFETTTQLPYNEFFFIIIVKELNYFISSLTKIYSIQNSGIQPDHLDYVAPNEG